MILNELAWAIYFSTKCTTGKVVWCNV